MPCSDRAWRDFPEVNPGAVAGPSGDGATALMREYSPEVVAVARPSGRAPQAWRAVDIQAALYRLAAYALLNLLDDAAMLAMMFS